eukprot:8431902-Pyramimonas_sp.AAC.1
MGRLKCAGVQCHSRVLFHCAVWGDINSSSLESLESSYLAPMRAAIGCKKQGNEFLEASKAE